jgi:spectinomycin phosphotransferase
MLAPPDGLPVTALTAALARGWDIDVASAEYQAVGWGSHHWAVTGRGGSRWFITVDDLEHKRLTGHEPLAAGFGRLRAALAAATALHDGTLREGRAAFVVAPVPARDGAPLARLGDRFAVAAYPFLDGRSFGGDERPPGYQHATLAMLVRTHAAGGAARRRARRDRFAVPRRRDLEAALDPAAGTPGRGPYAQPAARLAQAAAPLLRRRLRHYDHLVRQARAQPGQVVLTHGEPHPGNTMLTAGGWVLIDWDTALIAPPERDLWNLDPGDGTILRGYADATGVTPRPTLLELYRLRWDLTDLALELSRFRRPHTGNADDREAWNLVNSLVARLGTVPAGGPDQAS